MTKQKKLYFCRNTVSSKIIYTKTDNKKYMGRRRVYEVVKRMSAEELDKRIKKEKDTRVLKRLYKIPLQRNER